MRYMKTYESFRGQSNINDEEPVNELFGAIGRFFSNMFKKAGELIRKTKGGVEVDAIYNKYLDRLEQELKKSAGVSLNLLAAEKQAEQEAKNPPAAAGKEVAGKEVQGKEVQDKEVQAKKESLNYKNFLLIKEAEEAQAEEAQASPDSKMTPDTLKQKKALLDQIVKKIKDIALKEMDAVLTKNGGAAKNPQLQAIITAKKDQFDLDFLNAQIKYLEQAGDKTMVPNLVKQRDAITKKIEKTYKEMATMKPVEYKAGDSVIYLLKDKTKEEWDKLTPDEKKKPTEGKAKDIVGVKEIEKIEGDNFTLLDKDGKPTIKKTGKEIMGKAEGAQGADVDIKEGDTVVYKREKFDENVWKKEFSNGVFYTMAKSDVDKNKTIKELQDKEGVGIKKVSKIEGEEVSFEDADFKKKKNEILIKIEGGEEGEEGQGQKEEGQGQGQKEEGQGQGQKEEGQGQGQKEGQGQAQAQKK